MPRIVVTTDPASELGGGFVLDERIAPTDLESDHFAAQLIERIAWALLDADHAEQRSSD
jgi:hypothetical protein